MNLPNLLTLSRIIFLFAIVALLYLPFRGAPSLALVLFIIAALTDWLDGYYARKRGLISTFGKLMDALADKILMVGLFVTLVAIPSFLPWWFVFLILLIVTREFFITGLRLVAISKGVVLAAEKGGKIKTVFQIIAIAFLMLSKALSRDWHWSETWVSPIYYLGLGLLVLATVLTVQSGVVYLYKYWGLMMQDSTDSKS